LKLHSDPATSLNTVTAYGDDYIEINQVRYTHAVVFGPEGEIAHWPVARPEDIAAQHLRQAARLEDPAANPLAFLDEPEQDAVPRRSPDSPEVLLIGTGMRQRMLAHSLLLPLLRVGVGVEVMGTQAAARTYNILMAEGRRVIVALLPTGETQS
jgi:uncharacterized protein